jgi:hypothetical protein
MQKIYVHVKKNYSTLGTLMSHANWMIIHNLPDKKIVF